MTSQSSAATTDPFADTAALSDVDYDTVTRNSLDLGHNKHLYLEADGLVISG